MPQRPTQGGMDLRLVATTPRADTTGSSAPSSAWRQARDEKVIAREDCYTYTAALRSLDLRHTTKREGDTSVTVVTSNFHSGGERETGGGRSLSTVKAHVEKSFTTAIPDIPSPRRQLLSLPTPYHVHWPLSYCRGHTRSADMCRKQGFRADWDGQRGHVSPGHTSVRGEQVRHARAARICVESGMQGSSA